MTEEQARTNGKGLALGMGITFYVVRGREDRFLPVQIPSDDCESWQHSRHLAAFRINGRRDRVSWLPWAKGHE
jgi:hypothetical protein